MYDQLIEINGIKLEKKYIESLTFEEREDLIEPIFSKLRGMGWTFPDNSDELMDSYEDLVKFNPDLNSKEIFNNSSLATDICKYFCHNFYYATEKKKPTMIDVFYDDTKLRKIIRNRLGMDWLLADKKGPGVNEAFNLSFRMIVQGMRSMRMVNSTSIFKPSIAKYMCLKYSNEGDVVGDYSCGFGGRLLGAMSCGRQYIGTDPLTTEELEKMASFFNFKNYKLINSGSENYRGEKNSIDLYWSSPPYFDQEYYSNDDTQAYNKGEDYFYNVYWKNTLNNVKYMLKPGKWFGLNIKNYPKMLEMAKEEFGEVVEEVYLRTVRSHLNKTAGIEKMESIYMFKNNK